MVAIARRLSSASRRMMLISKPHSGWRICRRRTDAQMLSVTIQPPSAMRTGRIADGPPAPTSRNGMSALASHCRAAVSPTPHFTLHRDYRRRTGRSVALADRSTGRHISIGRRRKLLTKCAP